MEAYEIASDYDHEDPRWIEVRRTGIGASDMPVILGEASWGSPLALFAEKTGRATGLFEESEAMAWGKKLEPLIVSEFSARTGKVVSLCRETLRSREHPWALASLDAWTHDDEGNPVPLEAKAIGTHVAHEWSEGTPEYYRVQVHQQMLVTGSNLAYSAVLIGGQRFAWDCIERDETLIRKIVYHGARFWNLVVRGVPPESDGREATKAALARLYPEDDGSTLLLDGADWVDLYEELDVLAEQEKAIKARKDLLENRLKAALGASTTAVLLNGAQFSWKLQQRAAYTVDATEYRALRRKAPAAERAEKRQAKKRKVA